MPAAGRRFQAGGATNRLRSFRPTSAPRCRGLSRQAITPAASRSPPGAGHRRHHRHARRRPGREARGHRSRGRRIVAYDRATEDRSPSPQRIAQETGAIIVPSFDDVDIIEGQGTVGLESPSSSATSRLRWRCRAGAGAFRPECAWRCRLEGHPGGARRLGRHGPLAGGGEIVGIDAAPPPTRCDALQTPLVSPLTFGVLAARGARGLAVTEAEVEHAMRTCFREPAAGGGAGGVAALALC
jgi:threonine dehydratase